MARLDNLILAVRQSVRTEDAFSQLSPPFFPEMSTDAAAGSEIGSLAAPARAAEASRQGRAALMRDSRHEAAVARAVEAINTAAGSEIGSFATPARAATHEPSRECGYYGCGGR